MVADIVLGSAHLCDFLLQIFVLYRLHGQFMVAFSQQEGFGLLQNQACNDIVNENGTDIDNK